VSTQIILGVSVANLIELTIDSYFWNFDQNHVNSAVRFIPPVGCHVIGRDWARVEFGRIRSLGAELQFRRLRHWASESAGGRMRERMHQQSGVHTLHQHVVPEEKRQRMDGEEIVEHGPRIRSRPQPPIHQHHQGNDW
jgi:hypothetical protein